LNQDALNSLAPCLHLLRLCSPALPVGAYSYSQGLEWGVEAGWLGGEEQAGQWLLGLLRFPWTWLEVPVLARLHQAWAAEDAELAVYWNAWLLASRESAEMQAAEAGMGQALRRLLAGEGLKEAQEWAGPAPASFAAMFALAAARWGIGLEQACAGYLWTLAEGQVAAGMKLIPLGQSAGQRMLSLALAEIPAAVDRGLGLDAEDMGYLAPGLALASALHETQPTRLFRS
jgi:urease accessory protein